MGDKPDKPPARKVVDGKVGDLYYMPEGYEGKHKNAIGVPVDPPRDKPPPGKPMPVPAGDGGPDPSSIIIYKRPDFRKVKKNSPALPPKE
ncbi:hypothetical protein GCK72_006884 [Caenorhabditis remanei]|uniref:Uncharacterized protein n=1 Tax=Caenorhabditis remanei TaxID=31234 RepID=A0A6A5HJR7_CAERE|nr:hypothetical protein GCK72_006884 [Caenorhabditis remanei]KAF1766926.1 hypothetical protein GCK72_006884 [Caenorhabditis remanei]